jgi:hypothetical protein
LGCRPQSVGTRLATTFASSPLTSLLPLSSTPFVTPSTSASSLGEPPGASQPQTQAVTVP